MNDRLTAYAIAGRGEVHAETAVKLLVDLLRLGTPEPAYSTVYRPEKYERTSALAAVLGRLETKQRIGIDGAVPVDDVVEQLAARRENGDDVALIMLMPDSYPAEETEMVRRARAAGVRVLDLGGALDDVVLPDDAEEVPDEEPAGEAPDGDVLILTPELRRRLELGAMVEGAIRYITREEVAAQVAEYFAAAPDLPGAPAAAAAVQAEEVPDIGEEEGKPPFTGGTRVPAAANGAGRGASAKFRSAPAGGSAAEETVTYFRDTVSGMHRLAHTPNGRKRRQAPNEEEVELSMARQDSLVRAGMIMDPKDARK